MPEIQGITIKDYSKEVIQAMETQVNQWLVEAGLHLEAEAADELNNSPKRIDTGRLWASISNKPDLDKKAVYVGTNVDYAIYVHEGTRKMDANRFLRNAFEKNEQQVRDQLKAKLSGE